MTSDKQQLLWSVAITMIVALLLAGAETSAWPHLVGFLPRPMGWFCVLVYISLYRSKVEGFTTAYLLGATVSVYSGAPAGMPIFLSAMTFLGLRAVRSRIFWNGLSYFMMVIVAGVPVFNAAQILISQVFEPNAITHWSIFRWIGQMGTTALIGWGVYHLMVFLDRLIRDEAGTTETMGRGE